jgi:hypothetical protein
MLVTPEGTTQLNVPAVLKTTHEASLAVTLFDAALQGPVPVPLVALTLKVYAVAAVRPVTTNGDAAPVVVTPPGVDVTV